MFQSRCCSEPETAAMRESMKKNNKFLRAFAKKINKKEKKSFLMGDFEKLQICQVSS